MITRMQTFLSEKEFETLKAIVRTFAHPGMAAQIAEIAPNLKLLDTA